MRKRATGKRGSRLSTGALVPAPRIERCILEICGERVILDAEPAALYGVPTKALFQAVKRNVERFPPDSMLEPTAAEFGILRSQSVTSSWHGGWHGAH